MVSLCVRLSSLLYRTWGEGGLFGASGRSLCYAMVMKAMKLWAKKTFAMKVAAMKVMKKAATKVL